MPYQAPPGTQDLLPAALAPYRAIERAVHDTCRRHGFGEIRTPIFESTALFARAVGETTDIVEKEMFSFGTSDEGDEAFVLRPELTAPTVRAFLEHSLHKQGTFHKFYYLGPAFRKERPQKGRFRQFTQFGVEVFGSADPLSDVETILVFREIARAAGIEGVELAVNSIGCAECRPAIREKVRAAVASDLAGYCPNCRRRFERNPFRILDCKEPGCRERSAKVPPAAEHLCGACRGHFDAVRRGLDAAGVAHVVDARLVRGLDYYTRTVYEFRGEGLGSQNAVAGGGRYDRLIAEMGGPDLPAVGFAAGIERLAMLLEGKIAPEPGPAAYLVTIGPELRGEAFALLGRLRREGLAADMDFAGRSVKGQMREANARAARFAVVLGPDEWARGQVRVKDLGKGAEEDVALDQVVARLKEDRR